MKALPPGTIRLWTIKPIAFWDTLRAKRELYVDPTHTGFMPLYPDFEDFLPCYDWLREQMKARTVGYKENYPWWAWAEKPDLRYWRHRYYRQEDGSERYVRLELSVPQEQVLLSDFYDWYHVLWWTYFPISDEEEEAWEAEMEANGLRSNQEDLPEPFETRRRASWERIFDVEARPKPGAVNPIQATFERLDVEQVLGVTEFVAAGKTKR
jgi:hypothetical protein